MYERLSKTQGMWYVCGKHNSIWESKTDDDISAEVTEFLAEISNHLTEKVSQAYYKCKGKWLTTVKSKLLSEKMKLLDVKSKMLFAFADGVVIDFANGGEVRKVK